MSENNPGDPQPSVNPPDQGKLGAFTQQFSHNPVAARVPERVARGVLSSGVVVLDSPTEFVLDFLQGLTRPFQIVTRVVIPPPVMGQLVNALQDNLNKYVHQFGPPPVLPKPPAHRPTIQEIYENFKLPEDMLNGSYANSVMIGHSPTEFFLDFITGFYPTAAVSARVFIAAPQAPRMVETLNMANQQYQRRYNPQPPQT
jgi:hypothetical protein